MRRLLLLLGLILTAGWLLAACGQGASAAKPPEIHYGVDVAECGMIISDARFAASQVDARGQAVLYDDAGELALAAQQHGPGTDHLWVHDYDSKDWLDATGAFYVSSEEFRPQTPMGSGVVAFKTRQQGEVFAAGHQGTVMTWDEMMTGWHDPGMGMHHG